MVAVYALSLPTRKVSRRVALLTPRTSTPVAIGSRVPAWPTLRVPHSRRARPTTSWLVQPAGLSTTSRPSGALIRLAHAGGLVGLVIPGLGLLVRVGLPGVLRRSGSRRDRGVTLAGLLEEVLEVRSRLGDGVGEEVQARRQPDADLAAHVGAEPALVLLEQRGGLGPLRLVAEDGVEHRRVLEVVGHPHIGDRDEPQVGVLDDPLDVGRDEHLDPVSDLAGPSCVSHELPPVCRVAWSSTGDGMPRGWAPRHTVVLACVRRAASRASRRWR